MCVITLAVSKLVWGLLAAGGLGYYQMGNSDDVAFGPDGTMAWTAGAFSAVLSRSPDGEVRMLAGDLPAGAALVKDWKRLVDT